MMPKFQINKDRFMLWKDKCSLQSLSSIHTYYLKTMSVSCRSSRYSFLKYFPLASLKIGSSDLTFTFTH